METFTFVFETAMHIVMCLAIILLCVAAVYAYRHHDDEKRGRK